MVILTNHRQNEIFNKLNNYNLLIKIRDINKRTNLGKIYLVNI
jgi:hypothetical protein